MVSVGMRFQQLRCRHKKDPAVWIQAREGREHSQALPLSPKLSAFIEVVQSIWLNDSSVRSWDISGRVGRPKNIRLNRVRCLMQMQMLGRNT